MSTARFKIRNLTTAGAWSPSTDAGFDCAAGDELELQLEDSPALDIWITEFSCTDKSNGRTAPVFDPVTGIAATPTSGVSITMPAAEVGTWAIRSMTNGGGDGSEEETAQHVFTRYVAVRTVNLDLRHPLAGETTQYLDPGGWAVALQEMIDEVDAGAAGAVPPGRILTAGAGLTGGGDLSADRTFDVVVNADGGLIVTANEMQLGALGFARVQTALALASSSIDVNAQKIIDLLDPTNPQDAATKAYVDGVAGGLDALTAVLEDTATALNANGIPIRDLAAQLTFTRSGGAPAKAVHHTASAATATEGLRVSQTIAGGGGVGTGGESVSVALSLPNGSATDTVAASMRGQWTTVIGGGTAKIVWATATAGTLNDRMELSGPGVLTLNAYTTAGLLTNDGSGVLSSSNPAILVHGTVPTNITNGLNTQVLGGTSVLFQASGVEPLVASVTDATDSTVLNGLAIQRVPNSGLGVVGIGTGVAIRTLDDGGGSIDIGRLTWTTTNIGSASFASTMGLSAAAAGNIAEGATLTGAGVWTTVGKMQSDAGFDAATATALPIGGTATSITHSLASALQYTLSAAAFTWAEGLTTPTFTIAARTSDAATTTVELTGQTPWASATGTNRNAGSVRARIPSPTVGGAEGFFYVTISGADVMRGGRPSGTFEYELRFSPAATVLRPATISGSTVELFSGGLVFSTTNFNQRDQSQVLRVTRNITTAITDTYDASVTAITETWTTDASAAGGTWTRTGQRGASGFAGGSLALNVGDGGTLGTNAPGNLDVGLGTAVSSVTGKQRWMTVAGTAVIAQIGLAAGAYALLEGGAAATAGFQIASTAELALCGGGSSDVTIKTGGIAGTTQATITTALASFTNRVEAPRFVGSGATPTSTANALTISLDTQNPEHTTTEATTVTISGGTRFQTGTIMFSQGASGYTVTMPTNGVGVEYDDAIAALTVTGIVDATALTRTLLSYRILASGKAYIYARSVNTIP